MMSDLLPASPSVSSHPLADLARQSQAALTRPMDDEAALDRWLAIFQGRSPQTLRSYQNEVRRFRIFLATIHASNSERPPAYLLRDATEQDVQLYEVALRGHAGGKPIDALIVPASTLAHHKCRNQPFVARYSPDGQLPEPLSLKSSSVNLAINILHAMYQHWLKPDPATRSVYVFANPTARLKRSANRMQRQTHRHFPVEAIQAMLLALDHDARQAPNKSESDRIARLRLITSLLFGLWTRRSELAGARWADLTHSGRMWMLHLVRKGQKEQDLPVAPWLVEEIVRYRKHFGMTALPTPNEEGPIVSTLRRKSGQQRSADAVSPDTIYRDAREVARRAADMLEDGSVLGELATAERERICGLLRQVSPHWFRHSGPTIAINSGAMPLQDASKMLGHSTQAVTDAMYVHQGDIQIAAGVQRLAEVIGVSSTSRPSS